MRVFAVKCKDSETGYDMVLSECSYNIALDWLHRKQQSVGRDVFRIDNDDTWNYTIYTGRPTEGYDYSGQPERFFADVEKYHYDEKRGYLMCE